MIMFLLLHFNYHKMYVEYLFLSIFLRLFMVRVLCLAYDANHTQGYHDHPRKNILKDMKDLEKTLIGDP